MYCKRIMFLTLFQIANVMKQKIKVMFTHLQHFTTAYYTCKHVNKACTMNSHNHHFQFMTNKFAADD